jgi:hypothetical protein
MPISRKSILKSSHDLILIVAAVIAIAFMVNSMRHHWRIGSLGASDAVMMAAASVTPR